jgi:hypothetical protein
VPGTVKIYDPIIEGPLIAGKENETGLLKLNPVIEFILALTS